MYLTILSYEPTNQVLTFELPEYTRGFQVESMEEYISVTLGFNTSNIDWQTHEELPQLAIGVFSSVCRSVTRFAPLIKSTHE
jgi:hypothetical protein